MVHIHRYTACVKPETYYNPIFQTPSTARVRSTALAAGRIAVRVRFVRTLFLVIKSLPTARAHYECLLHPEREIPETSIDNHDLYRPQSNGQRKTSSSSYVDNINVH